MKKLNSTAVCVLAFSPGTQTYVSIVLWMRSGSDDSGGSGMKKCGNTDQC